jgi:hypothetical protein
MKYQNGMLRKEQDSTLWMRPVTQGRELPWAEYLPLLILGLLVVGLFIAYIW